jgi:hypothetical protein
MRALNSASAAGLNDDGEQFQQTLHARGAASPSDADLPRLRRLRHELVGTAVHRLPTFFPNKKPIGRKR